jgi:hypothetical protein
MRIPTVHVCIEVRQSAELLAAGPQLEDVSDGHTAVGFVDGSRRALDLDGLELKVRGVRGGVAGWWHSCPVCIHAREA